MSLALFLAEAGIITSIVVSLIIAAVSLVLSELLRPKPDVQDAMPPGLGDFQFPTAVEGRPIPVVFGTCQLKGPNVIWWGDFKARKQEERIKTGLWSSKKITTGFEYDVGFQMALCLGRVDEVSKIWIGEKVAASGNVQDGSYNINDKKFYGGGKYGNGGVKGIARVTSGSTFETNSTYLLEHQNPITPHRGVCTVTWEGGYIGNSTSIKPWAFEVKRFPNGLGLTGGKEVVNGADANPACVLYEILTDDDWGFGWPASDVNVAALTTIGNTLHTEGNGFSMVHDRVMEARDLAQLVLDQIDATWFLDHTTGQFTVSLARDDYDVDLVPQILEADVVEVNEFTRGTWEETINQVRVKFSDRDRDYFETYSQAHDLGNQRIQAGEIVSAVKNFPGVKDKSLANFIASRELRQLAVPLAKGTITVNRKFWDLKPNDVVAWTDDNLGFTKLPMRVGRIDYGRLEDGQIKLSLIQDVFKFSAAFFGEPDSTRWTPPSQDVEELDEALVIEAPYAITRRDPEDPENHDRVWVGARRNTGNEVAFRIWQRNASGTPSGAYTEDSDDVVDFLLIGELRADLEPGREDGQATIGLNVVSGGDSLADMQAAFTASPAAADIGSNLVNVVYIDGTNSKEFVGVTSVVNQTTHLDLQNCWRAMMDTVAGSHLAGDKVYLMFAGGDLNQSGIDQPRNVDVQPRANSFTDETTEGEATTFQVAMNNRWRRPYPPTMLEINDVLYDDEVDVDVQRPSTTSLDDRGLNFEWVRRDWQMYDETAGIATDAASIDGDFPSKHSTRYDVEVTALFASLADYEAFWRLEEASGTRFDESDNDHDLTDNNTVTQTTGQVGNCAVFDEANNEYLEASSDDALDFADEDVTFTVWVRVDNKTNPRAVIAKLDAGADERSYALSYNNTADRFRWAVSSDGTAPTAVDADSLGSPTASQWYFIRVWHDSVNDEIGIQVDNGAKDVASHSGGVHESATPFRLGALLGGSSEDAFQMTGRIDACGCWNRLLSDAEASVLWAAGSGVEPPFSDVTLWSPGFNSGEASSFLSRTSIVKTLDGGLPTNVRVTVATDHDADGTVRAALQTLSHDFTVGASALDNDTYLGTLSQNEVSFVYDAPDTGTYDFEIGAALSTGAVEARINGGSWTSVIAASSTTGTLGGVTAGDTIEVRHTEASVSGETFLQVDAPTSTAGAFGVLES